MMVADAVEDRLFQMAMSERAPPARAARIALALFDRFVPESRRPRSGGRYLPARLRGQ
jgi:hypothetical protein